MTEEMLEKGKEISKQIDAYTRMVGRLGVDGLVKITVENSQLTTTCTPSENIKTGLTELLESEIDRLQKEFDAL